MESTVKSIISQNSLVLGGILYLWSLLIGIYYLFLKELFTLIAFIIIVFVYETIILRFQKLLWYNIIMSTKN